MNELLPPLLIQVPADLLAAAEAKAKAAQRSLPLCLTGELAVHVAVHYGHFQPTVCVERLS